MLLPTRIQPLNAAPTGFTTLRAVMPFALAGVSPHGSSLVFQTGYIIPTLKNQPLSQSVTQPLPMLGEPAGRYGLQGCHDLF